MVIPCFCGLTLPDHELLRIFGPQELGDFIMQREIYYNGFRRRLFEHKNFPINNLNKLLKEAGLPPIEKDFQLKRYALRD